MDRELWIVDRPGDAWLVNRDGIASDLSLPYNRERGWRLPIHDPRSTIHGHCASPRLCTARQAQIGFPKKAVDCERDSELVPIGEAQTAAFCAMTVALCSTAECDGGDRRTFELYCAINSWFFFNLLSSEVGWMPRMRAAWVLFCPVAVNTSWI